MQAGDGKAPSGNWVCGEDSQLAGEAPVVQSEHSVDHVCDVLGLKLRRVLGLLETGGCGKRKRENFLQKPTLTQWLKLVRKGGLEPP